MIYRKKEIYKEQLENTKNGKYITVMKNITDKKVYLSSKTLISLISSMTSLLTTWGIAKIARSSDGAIRIPNAIPPFNAHIINVQKYFDTIESAGRLGSTFAEIR